MFKYVLKRLGLVIFSFFVILLICFFLIKLLPNPVPNVFGQDLELVLKRREALGYNEPIIVQFFIFLKNVLVYQDWGMSEKMYFGSDVWETFLDKLPATMIVNFYAMLVSVPIGLGLGIFAALKKNKWQDHVISTVVMLAISVPSYIYAFLVQYLLCFKWQILPPLMKEGRDYFSWDMFVSLLPAVIALSFGTIAGLTRGTRAELTEVLTSEFMLLARTKGLTKAQATTRHALRNSMVPIFPSILSEFIGIIGGSLIIEQIFGIPGVGPLYINSITALDYNFFLLLTCFYTLIGLTAGIVIDLSYGFIDPRIRMGAR
jgi:ABC-type dipeptide/oligopeptide/nickel transport system permease component